MTSSLVLSGRISLKLGTVKLYLFLEFSLLDGIDETTWAFESTFCTSMLTSSLSMSTDFLFAGITLAISFDSYLVVSMTYFTFSLFFFFVS